MKKSIVLEGLNCPNCATKIEQKVKNLKDIKNVEMNFISKTLTFESEVDHLENIKNVVKNLEPDVIVYEKRNFKNSKEIIDNHEKTLKNNIIRLIVGAFLFIIGLLIKNNDILQIIFLMSAYFVTGIKVLLSSIKNILKGHLFDENFLMGVATLGAISIRQIPEAVGVMLFFEIGEMFQNIALNNSRKSIKSLLDTRPDYANLFVNNEVKKVSPYDIKKNDIIIVKPGEKIPLDGFVTEGVSFVDTSALTGESVPRKVSKGNNVLGGFINKDGLIKVKVEKIYMESTLSKILEMVENASGKKAKTEKFITKFAKYYTPAVVFSAVALAIIPGIITGNYSEWIYRALLFLVISCPCALVLSIPLSFFAGIGKLSKKGILSKGGNNLESLKKLDTIIFDKTGTLTKGVFEVTYIKTFNNFSKNKILEYCAYAESQSNHPIAKSIIKKYNNSIINSKITEYSEIAGMGISAKINDLNVLVGNERLMKNKKIKYTKSSENGSVVYVAINNVFAGYIIISDIIRTNVKKSIKSLKNNGIKKIIMLTGDSKNTAKYVSENVGIDKFYSELLPQDKLNLLNKIKKTSGITGFVGDGINDAPVLTGADIGIAMGGLGSDAAIEAADIVIMDDDISKINDAIKISKRTSKIVWQNIIFIFIIKALFLMLGAFGYATMWEAVFADVGVSLIAVLNSLRILK